MSTSSRTVAWIAVIAALFVGLVVWDQIRSRASYDPAAGVRAPAVPGPTRAGAVRTPAPAPTDDADDDQEDKGGGPDLDPDTRIM